MHSGNLPQSCNDGDRWMSFIQGPSSDFDLVLSFLLLIQLHYFICFYLEDVIDMLNTLDLMYYKLLYQILMYLNVMEEVTLPSIRP